MTPIRTVEDVRMLLISLPKSPSLPESREWLFDWDLTLEGVDFWDGVNEALWTIQMNNEE